MTTLVARDVGLFGTCGNSLWRHPFIDYLDSIGATYFNPVVPIGTWKREYADVENWHLFNDKIILFPVTDETAGTASLGEIGFSIMDTIRCLSEDQYLVVYIDPNCNDTSIDNIAIKNSVNARHLVLTKCIAVRHPRIIVVDSLDNMMSAMKLRLTYLKQRQDFQKSIMAIQINK